MRQLMMTVTALAVLGAMVATAQAENQTANPQTVSGPVKKRAASQTARPSRAASAAHSTCTGMKSVCLSGSLDSVDWMGLVVAGCDMGPGMGPGQTWPLVGERARPLCEKLCNFKWGQCMKTGFWEGALLHRQAERR
jgi:hypothetical protein